MGASINKPNLNWLKNVDSTILLNLDNPKLLVADLAKSALMSERQFYREINKATELTPNKYIQWIKMKKAQEWINDGTFCSLKKLAQALGYSRTDYFSKIYKKYFGIPPDLNNRMPNN